LTLAALPNTNSVYRCHRKPAYPDSYLSHEARNFTSTKCKERKTQAYKKCNQRSLRKRSHSKSSKTKQSQNFTVQQMTRTDQNNQRTTLLTNTMQNAHAISNRPQTRLRPASFHPEIRRRTPCVLCHSIAHANCQRFTTPRRRLKLYWGETLNSCYRQYLIRQAQARYPS